MNPTPTSRTSKHASSRRPQQRPRQSRLPAHTPPPSTQPHDAMDAPAEVQVEVYDEPEVNSRTSESLTVAAMYERADGIWTGGLEDDRAGYPTHLSADEGHADSEEELPEIDLNNRMEESGHRRTPLLTSDLPPTTYLSRQLSSVQSYLPISSQFSSSGIPNLSIASFSPPKVSNITVSGTSSVRSKQQMSNDAHQAGSRHHNMESDARKERGLDGLTKMTSLDPVPFSHSSTFAESDDEADSDSGVIEKTHEPRYASSAMNSREEIVFASFSSISSSTSHSTRTLLLIGYWTGLQVWDTTHLGEVHELLNLRQIGRVINCAMLPIPRSPAFGGMVRDVFAKARPLIGIIREDGDRTSFLVYSMSDHSTVKRIDFSGATVVELQANSQFIVVATTTPLELHILCSATLNTVYSIPSGLLMGFSRPNPSSTHLQETTLSSDNLHVARDTPSPVFSLSSRFLAYASRPPSPGSPSLGPTRPRVGTSVTPSLHLGSLTVPTRITQADLGAAALTVGGGLISGMKALGGMAVAAARGDTSSPASSTEKRSGLTNFFFSRSAPAASGKHERRYSHGSVPAGRRLGPVRYPVDQAETHLDSHETSFLSTTPVLSRTSSYITVVDLLPILTGHGNGGPETVTEFIAYDNQRVSALSFSEDGMALSVVPEDGTTVRVFQIRSKARVAKSGLRPDTNRNVGRKKEDEKGGKKWSGPGAVRNWVSSLGNDNGNPSGIQNGYGGVDGAPWHVYNLRRGRTAGVVEDVSWAVDSRWVAIGTRNRTVHVFATNPYGGKPDEGSHMEGRVRNALELQPLSTELTPLLRLRASHKPPLGQYAAPLAFQFIRSSLSSMPVNLLPALNEHSLPSSAQTSAKSSPRKRPQSLSPGIFQPSPNFQDVLIFDPSNGILSLRRLTLSTHSADLTFSFMSSLPLPSATSISLPGVGAMGRLSASPTAGGDTTSGLSRMMEKPAELTGKDSTVATWNLMRGPDWREVKISLRDMQEVQEMESHQRPLRRADWLSNAELTTHSRSRHLLPSSIYLSHQFTFHALSEDYHALLRRSHFDIPSAKIDVRREVEVSAYPSGHGESFVQGGSSPQEIRRSRSSFDEPLASAISAGLDYSGSSPPVIPMLPNGVPTARSGSFRASMPIRNVRVGLTDGMNEGFGRLRREMGKVRSPRLLPRSEDSTTGSVPLEFDEQDEDFLTQGECHHEHEHDGDTTSRGTSRGGGDSGASISTPSTSAVPLAGGDSMDGWGPEDMDAVDEAERFDDISAAGFMDEEIRVEPLRRRNK